MVFRYHSKEDLEYHFWGKSAASTTGLLKKRAWSRNSRKFKILPDKDERS